MAKFYINLEGRITMEIEAADLKYGAWFSNWSGRTDGDFHYNGVDPETREGYKYFTIKIPEIVHNELDGRDYTVDDLASIGIPIKTYPGNPEKGYDDEHTIKVKVSFKFKPPVVKVNIGDTTDILDNETCHRLDSLMIDKPDLVLGFGRINEQNGRRPCYLQEFYANAVVSRMAMKHMDIPADDEDPFM